MKNTSRTKTRYKYRERNWIAISIYALGILLAILNLWAYYNLQTDNNSISGKAVEISTKDLLVNEVSIQLKYKSKMLENQNRLCNDSQDIELKANNNLFRNASYFFGKGDYSSSLICLKQIEIQINCSEGIESIFCHEASAMTGSAVEVPESPIKKGILVSMIILLIIGILFFILRKKN